MGEFVFAAFENSRGDLDKINEERKAVKNALDILRERDDNTLQVDILPDAGLQGIREKLIQFSHKITFFHLAGHHDKDYFPTINGEIPDDALEKILNNCPKLKLVFLNGCSTERVVNRLKNVPLVIGTKVPVRDEVAFQIAGAFYRALAVDVKNLSDTSRIRSCFERAIGVGMTAEYVATTERGFERINGESHSGKYIFIDNSETAADYEKRLAFSQVPENYSIQEELNEVIERKGQKEGRKLRFKDFFKRFPFIFTYDLIDLGVGGKQPSNFFLSEDRLFKIRRIYISLGIFLKYCGISLLWEKVIEDSIPLNSELKENTVRHVLEGWDEYSKWEENYDFLESLYHRLVEYKEDFAFVQQTLSFLVDNKELLRDFANCFSQTPNGHITKRMRLVQAEQFLPFFLDNCFYLTHYKFLSVYSRQYFKYKVSERAYEYHILEFIDKPHKSIDRIEEQRQFEVYSVYLENDTNKEEVINLAPFYVDFNTVNITSECTHIHYLDSYYPDTDWARFKDLDPTNEDEREKSIVFNRIQIDKLYRKHDHEQRIKLHIDQLMRSFQ